MLRARLLWLISSTLLAGLFFPSAEVSASQVVAASPAPDFAFQTPSYGWQHLHDLCSESAVLLIFDPSEQDLAQIQGCADSLAAAGLTPVAVTRWSDGANWKIVRRLGLSFSLMSDPAGVVLDAFGLQASGPSWVVIDGEQNMRAIRDGDLSSPGFAAEAASALTDEPGLVTLHHGQ